MAIPGREFQVKKWSFKNAFCHKNILFLSNLRKEIYKQYKNNITQETDRCTHGAYRDVQQGVGDQQVGQDDPAVLMVQTRDGEQGPLVDVDEQERLGLQAFI